MSCDLTYETSPCKNCGKCTPDDLLEIKDGMCLHCHMDKFSGTLRNYTNKECFGGFYCACSPTVGYCHL